MIYLIMIIFLYFQTMTIKAGRLNKLERYEKALIYNDPIIELLLNFSIIPWIGLSAYLLFFYSWKWFLILFIGGAILEDFLLFPIFSMLTIYPLYKYLYYKYH